MSLVEFDELNKNDLGYNGVPTYEKGFEAGQQSQQGEVDKLQTKIDELNERNSEEKRILHNVIEMNQAKIDELKKLRSLDEMEINQLAQANQVWQIKCDGLKKKLDRCREENKALLMKLNLPYGYKLVPVETTDEMRMAAYTMDGDLVGDTSDIYKAMIGAVEWKMFVY